MILQESSQEKLFFCRDTSVWSLKTDKTTIGFCRGPPYFPVMAKRQTRQPKTPAMLGAQERQTKDYKRDPRRGWCQTTGNKDLKLVWVGDWGIKTLM